MRRLRLIGLSAGMAVLLALPSSALAVGGAPIVEMNPPDPDLGARGEGPVTINPGQLIITFADGGQLTCTISPEVNPPDPDLPPHPLRPCDLTTTR